jgi:hypothetical protein
LRSCRIPGIAIFLPRSLRIDGLFQPKQKRVGFITDPFLLQSGANYPTAESALAQFVLPG